MYSQNEIQSTLRKAIIGAGYDTGIAEDISKAGVWLCCHRFQGADEVLKILKSKVHPVSTTTNDDGVYTFKNICVLSCGPSILDMLLSEFISGASESRVYLENIDNPLIFVALAANVAKENNVEIDIHFVDCESIVVSPSKTELISVDVSSGANALIKCNRPKETSDRQQTIKNEDVSISIFEKILQELEAFSAKTYVPATEASRLAGAGAGLTDND